jgi:hypothetical protein
MAMKNLSAMLLLGLVWGVAGCAEPEMIELGPVDGHELAGIDLERVQVGQEAPDFSLLSFLGDTVTLSDYRGSKDVILVFYRGSW